MVRSRLSWRWEGCMAWSLGDLQEHQQQHEHGRAVGVQPASSKGRKPIASKGEAFLWGSGPGLHLGQASKLLVAKASTCRNVSWPASSVFQWGFHITHIIIFGK